MLAHYHTINKGVLPFRLTADEAGLRELSKAAGMDEEQVEFVKRTSALIQDPRRG